MVVVGQQRSVEDFVEDAISSLAASLPAALAAQTAKYAAADAAANRDVLLVAPRPEDYYPGGSSGLLRYPAIEVSVPDLSTSGVWDIAQRDVDTVFPLMVVAFEQHPRQEILYRKMLRFGAACYDVLAQKGALGTAELVSFRASWRYNPEQQTNDEVQSGVVLSFGLKDAWLRP